MRPCWRLDSKQEEARQLTAGLRRGPSVSPRMHTLESDPGAPEGAPLCT